ncbi:MAG: hypothetical protein HYY17_05870 [Planctomycetes bacterium]|nr:hypothetical protein [Planctomycetota bacterium]
MGSGIRALLLASLLCVGLSFSPMGTAPADAGRDDHGAKTRFFQFAISADGSAAYVAVADRHTVVKVRLSDGDVLASRKFRGKVSAIELSRDASLLAVALTGDDRVVLVNPDTLEPVAEAPVGELPRLLEFGVEGTDLCVLATKSEEIDVIDVPSRGTAQIVPLPSRPASMAHYGERVAVCLPETGEIAVFSHPAHELIATVPVSPTPDWICRASSGDSGRPGHAGHQSTYTSRLGAFIPPGSWPGGGMPGPALANYGLLVITSRESDTVSIVDGGSLAVLATASVRKPFIATGGCGAWQRACVLGEHGKRLSVLDTDRASPTFGTVLFTVKLAEPCETLESAADGTCWLVGVSRMRLYAVDPMTPSSEPTKAVRIKRHRHECD